MSNTKIKIAGIVFLMILFISACKENKQDFDFKLVEINKSTPFLINADSIEIEGDLGNFSISKSEEEEKDGIKIIKIRFTADSPSELNPIDISFKIPSIDINGYWNPDMKVDKVNYWSSAFSAKASRNAPILTLYNNALKNRITIALSDAINKSSFSSYLKEEDVHFYPKVRLFQERMPKTTHYEISLRIDTRPLPYYQVIDDVASWWAADARYEVLATPDAAKRPMYSTWYSYHQNISHEEIVRECKIAKTLGCDAVIVDDGWQTNDNNRGYAYTGDWNPDRIPDMRAFVDAVHNEGMKFLLWYSVPFMGEKAENFSRFKGKYLHYWESQNTYVMDPRYPEVREYILNTYIKAMNEWNLDGFKFDFIGRFTAYDDTELTKEDGRDYASVNEATDALMTEITTKLKEIKPDILIEFRQPYIGPVMRKYGNMFRGVDCPNNAVANKIEITNLRILSQNTAVHSDMFIWRKEENVEQAALQILNILYSVPQLSVRLEEIPEEHLDMIKYWFKYWNDHRSILLDGEFIPSNPGSNYPSLTAINAGHQISTLYDDVFITVPKSIDKLDLINAKSSTKIAFNLEGAFKGNLIIRDVKGKIVFEQELSLSNGINELNIPYCGMASLRN